jgi:hypothetical protein
VDVANVFDRVGIENMANWEMRGAGPDGIFDTADDVVVPLTLTRPYLIGTNRLYFTLQNPLAPDVYRFKAFANGLRDPMGTPMASDFVRRFTVVP